MKFKILCLLTMLGANINAITNPFKKKTDFEKSQELLNQIKNDFQGLRVIIADTLEKNKFEEKNLKKLIINITKSIKDISALQNLTPEQKAVLSDLAKPILLIYQAILEEAGVLELWMRGYVAYERDLDDNFKNLGIPGAFFKKPNNKKLYQELGITDDYGKNASFNQIRSAYQEKFNYFKKLDPNNFSDKYFRPYLRVLDYVFRTPYGKVQYDTYLSGEAQYNKKIQALNKYKTAIENLFTKELPELGMNLKLYIEELK